MKNILVKGAIALGLVLVGTGDAQALKDTTYAGAGCVRDPLFGGVANYFLGTISNVSPTSEMTVICPVNGTENTLHATPGAGVVVFARHPTIAVSCTLNSSSISGSTITTLSGENHVVNGGASAQSFNIVNSTLDDAGGYYWMKCIIPRMSGSNASHVAHYIVLED